MMHATVFMGIQEIYKAGISLTFFLNDFCLLMKTTFGLGITHYSTCDLLLSKWDNTLSCYLEKVTDKHAFRLNLLIETDSQPTFRFQSGKGGGGNDALNLLQRA